MSDLRVIVSDKDRDAYIQKQLEMDGLTGSQEVPCAAYCAISLTYTPEEFKPELHTYQNATIDVLNEAGITAYDPASAPYSPDVNHTSMPEEIYRVDAGKIVTSRFFVSYDVLPSTGQGVEYEIARRYNRMMIIIHNTKIRTSRMQVNRAIHVQVDNIRSQSDKLVELITYLKEFTPGIGLNGSRPVLLGFKDSTATDLEDAVKQQFPELTYYYNPEAELIRM